MPWGPVFLLSWKHLFVHSKKTPMRYKIATPLVHPEQLIEGNVPTKQHGTSVIVFQVILKWGTICDAGYVGSRVSVNR